MVILVIGATGFIGTACVRQLQRLGYSVIAAGRDADALEARFPDLPRQVIDLAADAGAAHWLPGLAGVDTVINAAGVFAAPEADQWQVHSRGPAALFEACAQAGVRRVIQISALGADEDAESLFHRSKREADAQLAALPLEAVIVQPSLVFGEGGTSAGHMALWASLPLIPLPEDGGQRIQPLHIDDLAAAIAQLVAAPAPPPRLAAVGPEPLTLRDYLATLARAQGRTPRFLSVPRALLDGLAKLRPGLAEPLAMLRRGNTADTTGITALVPRPRPARQFIPAEQAAGWRRRNALALWATPLRLAIALMWIVSGLVSVHPASIGDGLAWLGAFGFTGGLAQLALYGAALFDVLLGIAVLLWRRRLVWTAQIALVVFYTAAITWKLPELWLHPFGPVLKNVPVLLLLLLLRSLEKR